MIKSFSRSTRVALLFLAPAREAKMDSFFKLQTLQTRPGSWLWVPTPWPVEARARAKVAERHWARGRGFSKHPPWRSWTARNLMWDTSAWTWGIFSIHHSCRANFRCALADRRTSHGAAGTQHRPSPRWGRSVRAPNCWTGSSSHLILVWFLRLKPLPNSCPCFRRPSRTSFSPHRGGTPSRRRLLPLSLPSHGRRDKPPSLWYVHRAHHEITNYTLSKATS